MEKPVLSIIIPVYNVETYLKEAIDSILHQSFVSFEILLINDGSIDNSGFICDEYVKQDSRIKVFHQKNSGVSAARNLGLDNAKGEYITFLDPDDYLVSPNVYQKIFESISQDIDIVYFGFKLGSDNLKGYIPPISGILNQDQFLNSVFPNFVGNATINFFKPFHITSVWSSVYRKEILKNIRFQNIKRTEDKLFLFETIFEANRLLLLQEEFYFYRLNPNSVTRSYSSSFIEDMTFSINYQKILFLKNGIQDKIIDNLNNFILCQFYSILINESFVKSSKESLSKISDFAKQMNIFEILTWKVALGFSLKNPLWTIIKLQNYPLFFTLTKLKNKIRKYL